MFAGAALAAGAGATWRRVDPVEPVLRRSSPGQTADDQAGIRCHFICCSPCSIRRKKWIGRPSGALHEANQSSTAWPRSLCERHRKLVLTGRPTPTRQRILPGFGPTLHFRAAHRGRQPMIRTSTWAGERIDGPRSTPVMGRTQQWTDGTTPTT